MDLQALSHPYTPGAPAGPESLLLVWDAPNLDICLLYTSPSPRD